MIIDSDRLLRKAAFVSRRVAGDYPGIEVSDIEQAIHLYIAENRSTFEQTETEAGLEKFMYRAGRAYASKERYDYLNHSAAWVYTPSEIRAIFEEAFFNPVVWETMPVKDDSRTTLTAKGIVVCLWDISEAFDSLPINDQIALHTRYEYGVPTSKTEDKRIERAIDKITDRVNGGMARRNMNRRVDAADVAA